MTVSSKKKAYELILQDVIRGTFAEDHNLLNERRLIERYGIGKTPIREALVELCNEKVLRSIPRYGYEIITLTQQDIAEVLQVRCMLECSCLRLMAPHVTRDALLAFRGRCEEEEQQLRHADVWEAWDSNVRIHLQLCSFAQNRYCQQMLESSMGILKRAYAQFYLDQQRTVHKPYGNGLHMDIVDRLLAGDVDGAEAALREDICSFEKLIFML